MFISFVAPTPRCEPSELQNLHINNQPRVCLRKIHNLNGPTLWYSWHGFEKRIIDNATDKWCKRL